MKSPLPLVSICVLTFQHARFIHKCLDGILEQETKFSYEIIIGEDESNDGTREICKEYAAKYPDKIRLFLGNREEVKILFGKPVGQNNLQKILKEAKGKYIAICEGDDHWTDPNKLQKQVNYLELNHSAGGCFHDVCNIDENGKVIKENYYTPSQKKYNQADCLIKLNSSYATCSLVARSDVFMEEWPTWFKERTCDDFIDLMVTRKNRTLDHISENMGAYRIHSGGLWQGSNREWQLKDKTFRVELLLDNQHFQSNYKTLLSKRLGNLNYRTLANRSYKLDTKQVVYKSMIKNISYSPSLKSLLIFIDGTLIYLINFSIIQYFEK